MRGSGLHHFGGRHPGRSLAARGGPMRTFASFTIFLALTLLCLGAYLIEDEFANPLAAQSIGLFAAAFVLAAGVLLLYYWIQPRKASWRVRPTASISADCRAWTAKSAPAAAHVPRRDLPFQRWYVDPVRVRLRR